MMIESKLTTVFVFVGALFVGCGGGNQVPSDGGTGDAVIGADDPFGCTGCKNTLTGQCMPEISDSMCGAGGSTCQDCTLSGQTCSAMGVCISGTGGDPTGSDNDQTDPGDTTDSCADGSCKYKVFLTGLALNEKADCETGFYHNGCDVYIKLKGPFGGDDSCKEKVKELEGGESADWGSGCEFKKLAALSRSELLASELTFEVWDDDGTSGDDHFADCTATIGPDEIDAGEWTISDCSDDKNRVSSITLRIEPQQTATSN